MRLESIAEIQKRLITFLNLIEISCGVATSDIEFYIDEEQEELSSYFVYSKTLKASLFDVKRSVGEVYVFTFDKAYSEEIRKEWYPFSQTSTYSIQGVVLNKYEACDFGGLIKNTIASNKKDAA